MKKHSIYTTKKKYCTIIVGFWKTARFFSKGRPLNAAITILKPAAADFRLFPQVSLDPSVESNLLNNMFEVQLMMGGLCFHA